MNTKLTITLEKNIIEQAKAYAKSRGRSLSELIENYLKVVIEEPGKKIYISPAINKLKGSIKLPSDLDYKKELTKALNDKYAL